MPRIPESVYNKSYEYYVVREEIEAQDKFRAFMRNLANWNIDENPPHFEAPKLFALMEDILEDEWITDDWYPELNGGAGGDIAPYWRRVTTNIKRPNQHKWVSPRMVPPEVGDVADADSAFTDFGQWNTQWKLSKAFIDNLVSEPYRALLLPEARAAQGAEGFLRL